MVRTKQLFLIIVLVTLQTITLFGQDTKKAEDVHQFTMLHQIKATPVKDQGRTGTCWSFATTSFIEAELLRMGKGEYDLSEMFNVRETYPERAGSYIRYHGKFNFGNGGQAHDVMHVVRNFGILPESVYSGHKLDNPQLNHGEMDEVLDATVEAVLKKAGGELTTLWKDVIDAELNIYMGEVPQQFEFNDKKFTPKSFAAELGINPDDYIEFTSYTHHPFYQQIDLEIPDNFRHSLYYNVPIDDIIKIMDNAVENGYTVAWDGDVGSKQFLRKEGYAVIPIEKESGNKDKNITEPEEEKQITQADRQKAFDVFDTTDDHLMHITGLAEDQSGTKFYYTKNSWGTDNKYDGYWYMSEPYVRLRTVAIMVHKDALPDDIKSKLGF